VVTENRCSGHLARPSLSWDSPLIGNRRAHISSGAFSLNADGERCSRLVTQRYTWDFSPTAPFGVSGGDVGGDKLAWTVAGCVVGTLVVFIVGESVDDYGYVDTFTGERASA